MASLSFVIGCWASLHRLTASRSLGYDSGSGRLLSLSGCGWGGLYFTHVIYDNVSITWVKQTRYYTGKMGIVCMGNIDGEKDQDSSSRTEEKRLYAYTHSGGSRDARCESEIPRNQSERTYRANSTQSSIFSPGTSDDGGILRQLIKDYRDQMAARRDQVAAKKAEIKRLEDETEKLEFRIQEFETLQKQLEQESEQLE